MLHKTPGVGLQLYLFLQQSLQRCPCLASEVGAELKKTEWSSPKHALNGVIMPQSSTISSRLDLACISLSLIFLITLRLISWILLRDRLGPSYASDESLQPILYNSMMTIYTQLFSYNVLIESCRSQFLTQGSNKCTQLIKHKRQISSI